jgi:hypothetical protein
MAKVSEVVNLRGSDFWDCKLQSNEARAIVEKNKLVLRAGDTSML